MRNKYEVDIKELKQKSGENSQVYEKNFEKLKSELKSKIEIESFNRNIKSELEAKDSLNDSITKFDDVNTVENA
jgi:hypothetical protein